MAQYLIPGVGLVNDNAGGTGLLIPGAGLFKETVSAGGPTYTLTAASGSFALSSTDATLAFNRVLPAASGSFTLAGAAATLTHKYTLTAEAGSFALTGTAATLTHSYRLTADAGSFALSGTAATLTYTPVSGATYTLVAASGSFALTGAAATLAFNRVLAANAGSIVLTGAAATLTHTYGSVSRPSADTVAGAWLPSTGSNLYEMVNEAVADDSDYIYATTNTTCKMALSPVNDPATSSGQVVSYRAWSPTGNGMVARLKQGGTTIATWTHATLPATATTYQQALSAAECDAITDYTALAIELESTV